MLRPCLAKAPRAAAACLLVVAGLAACSDTDDGQVSAVADAAPPDATAEIADTPTDTGYVQLSDKACSADADCAGAFELLPCEQAVCAPEYARCAVQALADGSPCKDGQLCTGPDFCIGGKCGGGPLNCDDKSPCTQDFCDGKSGCVNKPLSGPDCEDGSPCTVGDVCDNGECQGGAKAEGCCSFDGECDDGQPCTDDDCTDKNCVHAFNFAPCDDANPCTLKDHCDGGGACGGTELLCDDGNPCSKDVCLPETGTCTSAPASDGTPCEDGNPCTAPDACQLGKCVGAGSLCQCKTHADCAAAEDGDLCNGTLVCVDFTCKINPVTVVACNPTGDSACSKNLCDAQTGQCVKTALAEGGGCDDQNPCTGQDACQGGACVGQTLSCDDGSVCTLDFCSPTVGCQHTANNFPCDDGDACTVNDQCGAGKCAGAQLPCTDGNPCTDDACDGKAGCTFTANAASCNDGNPCTSGDKCQGGSCVAGPSACQCQTDADCKAQDDADLCNGVLTCQANKCAVAAGSVVQCNTAGDTPCAKTVCAPATGQCGKQSVADGTTCNDGSACTQGDACKSGGCAGNAVICNDQNPCTDDACDAAKGCTHVPNGLPCSDGNACTANDKCAAGSCGGVAVACEDGNPCTVDSCDKAKGCVGAAAATGTPCNDQNLCTAGDQCSSGQCAGKPVSCDDKNPCSADTCTPTTGCANPVVANGTPCDDGSACSQGDQCTNGKCLGNPPSCDDGNPCTTDTCDAAVGCSYKAAADGTSCSDGNSCTGPDGCVQGACQAGKPTCQCVTTADCAALEDGNLCNGTLECVANACQVKAATVVTCPASTDACKVASCTPATGKCGLQPGPVGKLCDDGTACTTNDTCDAAGTCKGFPKVCDDKNPCTTDTCDPAKGCANATVGNGTPCNDGTLCTKADACINGACQGTAVACDDGNPCTTDSCDPLSGCKNAPVLNGTACNDGNACSGGDTCQNGLCQGGPSVCQCQKDADCAGLEDGNLCNGTLQCQANKCVVNPLTVVQCNPTGDTACSKNTCAPATGQCAPKAVPDGAVCNDGNACTGSDVCKSGLCQGVALVCDDKNPCTNDVCSAASGCQSTANTNPCNDGNACTSGDVCGGGVCKGAAVVCNDGNPCTDDSCNVATGCAFAANTAACSDGNACTTGDKCGSGKCVAGANTCQCVSTADCAKLEDGNLCNGTLVCTANKCVVDAATVVTCDTSGDTTCAKTTCAAGTGKCSKNPVVDGTTCSDGSACTSADACKTGACTGVAVVCNDGNGCTDDACDPAKGCGTTFNSAPCNDNNLCTANDQCQAGACVGAGVGCDDGNPCTVDSCDKAKGCVSAPAGNGTPCNDGSACTAPDQCTSGKCGGAAVVCDDKNACTTDTCAPASGCVVANVADGTACTDGSACTQGDKCTAGKCGGSAVVCDDGNPCTTDSCDPASGCKKASAADGTACTDGNPCTSGDGCKAGACVGGPSVCQCQTKADCAPLEDGNLCNGTLICSANKCVVDAATVVTCSASPDACKANVCTAATGKCALQPANAGKACDDGDGCTQSDACDAAGACKGVAKVCNDGNPCTLDSCAGGACTAKAGFDGTPCADDGNSCTLDVCSKGACSHPGVAEGTQCADDGTVCTTDVCQAGLCKHPAVADGSPCGDDGNVCTFDSCKTGVCQHVSNDPPSVSSGQCLAVQSLGADTGKVSGKWTDCGTADNKVYKCKGPNCTYTGAISTWGCSAPGFLYDGENTGYEYTYQFVAPVDGVCTFIEYNEGIPQPGNTLFGVIDWFLVDGAGACTSGACKGYMWENKYKDPTCGGGNAVCSYMSFNVTQGQKFYLVADIFDGAGGHQGYPFPSGWSIEMKCSATQKLLLSENFNDAKCDGCTIATTGAGCKNLSWHPVGGFADLVQPFYVGQLQNSTLLGYDCGAATAKLTFPTAALPSGAKCTLSFDYYAEIAPGDDGGCTDDLLQVQVSVNGGAAQLVPGDTCKAKTASSNVLGWSQKPNSKKMTYDLSSLAGKSVALILAWSQDATENNGLGAMIDDVQISCTVP